MNKKTNKKSLHLLVCSSSLQFNPMINKDHWIKLLVVVMELKLEKESSNVLKDLH